MAYLKDKKITILRQIEDYNDYGEPINKTEPLPGAENIWAYYRQASGNEFFAAMTANSKVEAIFKIAWRNDIDTTMKILFRGKEYYITRIDDFEGNKEDITIYAYTLGRGNQ